MAGRGRPAMFSVPAPDVDPIMRQVAVRAAAKLRAARAYDPALGDTWDEAEARINAIKQDVGLYGEYVYGLRPARVHQLWNSVIDDVVHRRVRPNKLLIIAPPNSAKSTWNSVIRSTFHLGQHPEHNLIFMTSSDQMAKGFHSTVEAVLRESAQHRQIFEDYRCRPNKSRGWSSDGLYLRGTPVAAKDPAFKAVGYTTTVMGARADGIFIDDPMNQEQARSPAEQAKAARYFDQTVVPRLQPTTGWIVVNITRYHEADFASHCLKLAQNSGDWIVVKTPMIATNDPDPDPLGRATGDLLWPERFTADFVQGERERLSIAEFNLIHQCLKGDTPFSLTSLPRQLYRRWYEGPFVEITTAGGKKLAGTPNHPILTESGWLPLDQCVEGTDVVCGSPVDIVGTSGQDIEGGHTTLREFFDAAAVAGQTQLSPATKQDFHGDGFDPQVDVIDVDSLLMNRLQTQFPKIFSQLDLGGFYETSGSFVGESPLTHLLLGQGPAVDNGVHTSDLSRVRSGAVSDNTIASRSALRAQGLLDLSQLVPNSRRSNSITLADLSEGIPFAVSLDKIINIVRNPAWAGHVYNLETEDHRYVADSIITHNCDPTGMGGDIFTTEEWFQGLPENFWSDILPRCYVLQAWDMAFSDKKKACYTVGITAAVDPELNMYILHVVRKKVSTTGLADLMVTIIDRTRPAIVAIETDRFHQQTIVSVANQVLERVFANIQLVRPTDDKISRARLPAGRAEVGKLFVNKNTPWYRALVTECLGFPNTRYKDQVDTLSLITLVAEQISRQVRANAGRRRQVVYSQS